MYQATGLPGWMRFGFSPGWVGRSASGLGPCAEYMMTGRWPMPYGQPTTGTAPATAPPQAAAPPTQASQPVQPAYGPAAPLFPFNPMGTASKDQQIAMLEEQATALESQLKEIEKRIQELKSG